MAIPNYQQVMRPLLALLEDGQVKSMDFLRGAIADHFKLTPEEREKRFETSKAKVIRSRVGWARTYLHKAGLLALPEKAHCQITERGLTALKECPNNIDNNYLKRFPEFLEFTSPSNKEDAPSDEVKPETTEAESPPDEQMESAHNALNHALASQLLDAIKEKPPQFFEKLVVDLMQAMGYGGWSAESGYATQYAGDGGIDGIINEDPLGLDAIYLQAKRYTESAVGRPAVQGFVGALEMNRARKGVFITTSRFSSDALDYIKMIEKKVVLIDGEKLAKLMIANNIGVTIKNTYYLKDIDTDYFLED